MSCDEVRELLGAYVLDAVTDEDRLAIEEHLADCDLHPELAELRAAALGFGVAAPERRPSPDLQDRIMRTALEERPRIEQRAAPGEHAAPPAPEPPSPEPPTALPQAAVRSYRGLAAALAVVAIGLAAWVGVLLAAGDGDRDLLTYSYRGRGGETSLLIQTVVGEGPATVTAAGLRRLEAGEAYHLWAIRDERWTRVGFFNTNPEGRWRGDFDFLFASGDEVAVTIGSAGGDARPEREPLFRSPI